MFVVRSSSHLFNWSNGYAEQVIKERPIVLHGIAQILGIGLLARGELAGYAIMLHHGWMVHREILGVLLELGAYRVPSCSHHLGNQLMRPPHCHLGIVDKPGLLGV